MKTLEELDAEIAKLSGAKSKITTALRKEENAKLIGKAFRYQNSYGGDEPRKRWWLYVKLTSMDKDGWLNGVKAQRDCDGRINIEPETFITYHLIHEGYQPITEAAWKKHVDSILAASRKTLLSA